MSPELSTSIATAQRAARSLIRLFNPADREELDQEVAIRIIETGPEYAATKGRHAAVDFVRARLGRTPGQRKARGEGAHCVPHSDEYHGDSGRFQSALQMAIQLRRALASLPERDRYVLVHWCIHGETLAEIADVLGVTEARVCQIAAEALADVRRAARGERRVRRTSSSRIPDSTRREVVRRVRSGERQVDLAREVGVTQACVSRWVKSAREGSR